MKIEILTTSETISSLGWRYVKSAMNSSYYDGHKVCLLYIPEMTSLGQLLGKTFRSCRGTRTPSMLPNIEDRPRQKSMMKNRTDQSGDSGILVIASVNTMKARPVPSTPCESVKLRDYFSSLMLY